jgi:AcrR family transcriptional regulator
MLGAMVQEISERGVANVSVAHVVARSGVSRRTFYEIFHDCEDCYLAAFDNALHGITTVVIPAYEQPGSWRIKVRAALTTALECLEDDHETARLLIVESLAAGLSALQRRNEVLEQIVAIIERGNGEDKHGNEPPPLTGIGVVGGVLSVLHGRLTTAPEMGEASSGSAQGDSLLGLAGPLMGMIVLPYLGPAAARKELAQPIPTRSGARRPLVRSDPLQDLEMRLTYRTVRVLSAIANEPGSSNRSLGDAAGIGDQGQVSKLLARLQRLGLIENEGIGAAARGEPNAWTLTHKGHDIHNAIANVPA